jgi:predicted DNA-binding transcriptional regulator YafY
MSKHGSIKRYHLIIELIKNNQYPSFDEIKDFLFENAFEISSRTIQRDIEQIRFEFGVEIAYDNYKKGYYINYDKSVDVETFVRFLEIVATAELLTDSLKNSKDTLKYISFDTAGGLIGIENLNPLLKAMKEKRIVSFQHQNYQAGTLKDYVVNPYLLKEYQNRWYLVAFVPQLNQMRTFGVDRIRNIEIKTQKFIKDNTLNPKQIFENIIGLIFSDEKLQKIILSFTPAQGKYIKSLPMHKSQEILIDNETELRICLYLIPNFELQQQILMYGDSVTVIEPKSLVQEIKETLQSASKKYF